MTAEKGQGSGASQQKQVKVLPYHHSTEILPFLL